MQAMPFQSYESAVLEDRCGARSEVAISALLDHNDKQWPIFVTDLSVAGFAAEIAVDLTIGAPCLLRLPNSVAMLSVVVWAKAGTVGCSFNRLLDPKTLERLLKWWRD